MKYKHSVYIGRFQPIHEAHLASIKIALELADHLILFIGSAKRPPDIKNPWSFDERKIIVTRAIREYFGEEPTEIGWSDYPKNTIMSRITILPLRDYMYSETHWISEVYAGATSAGAEHGTRNTILLGGYKDDSSYYLNSFPYWSFKEINMMFDRMSAIDVRYDLFKYGEIDSAEYVMPSTKQYAKDWMHTDGGIYIQESYDFHVAKWKEEEIIRKALEEAGIEYFPRIDQTVDALVVKSGCVLLIKRKIHPGKGLWALPGGYLNAAETMNVAVARELKEETNIMVPMDLLLPALYRKDPKVFNHPLRSLRRRIITHVFKANLGSSGQLPTIKAGDDAKEAHWIPLYDALQLEDKMFEDHYDILFNMMVSNK